MYPVLKKFTLAFFILTISLNAFNQLNVTRGVPIEKQLHPNPSGALSCSNWLYQPSEPSYVDVGNLNITGDKITVEATINRTQPYNPGIGNGNEGDIVSKHNDPSDVNYLLRPNHAYITHCKLL